MCFYLLPVIDGVEGENFWDILSGFLNEDLTSVLEHFDCTETKKHSILVFQI